MEKLLCLLALGMVAAGPVRAQTFRPGWVLPAQGDTLRGEVEDDAWDDAPTRVRFRPAAGAAITTYTPTGLRAFRLAGGRYFRYETLPLDRTAQTTLSGATTTVRRNPQSEAFLAEVLVDGPASLLRTAVGSVQHYFVRRENRPVLELAERKYLRQQGSRTVLADASNYQAELTQYFGDCPAAVQAIAFTAAGLVRVVQAYNRQCAAPPQAGTEYRPASRPRLGGYAVGLIGGARYSSYLLQANQASPNSLLDNYNLDGAVHPIGGVFADAAIPGRRFALHLSLLLMRSGHSDQFTPPGSLVARLDNQVTLLETRLGGRYFWATTRHGQQFFVGAGLAVPAPLGQHKATLTYYDTNQKSQQVDYLPNACVSSVLPYLELGMRQGRFTLSVDGQSEQQADTNSIFSYLPQTGAIYLFTNTTYSGRPWYVEATLSVALLWKE